MVRGWRESASIYTRTTPRTAPFQHPLQLDSLQALSSMSISRLIWAQGNSNNWNAGAHPKWARNALKSRHPYNQDQNKERESFSAANRQ